MLVDLVAVAAGGVGLPDLDQRPRDGAAVAVEQPAGDHDPLAQRLAGVLAGQVVVVLGDPAVAQQRAGDLGQGVGERDQRPVGGAQPGGQVRRVQVRRLVAGRRRATRGLGHGILLGAS